MSNLQLVEEPEIPGLGPDYCYVCQKLIKRSQKRIFIGGEYYRHENCAPGSAKWMRSEAAKHPKSQPWTQLFLRTRKARAGIEEPDQEERISLTWEEVHSMSREELYILLEEEEIPEEEYSPMETKEIMDTLCVMFDLSPAKKKRRGDS